MLEKFNVSELESKSVEELRTILADESLLMEGDTSDELIFKITELIDAKENKSENQQEAERIRFWAGLVARYDGKIPIKLEDVIRRQRQTDSKSNQGSRHFQTYKAVRRIAIAAAAALVLVVGNSFAAFAFNFNFLQAVVNFTDDIFVKTFTSSVEKPNSDNSPHDLAQNVTLQEALDAFNIERVHEPEYLPNGYEFDVCQVTEFQNSVNVVAQYTSEERVFTISITSYSKIPNNRNEYIEKSAGEPTIYSYAGIEVSIFSNIDRNVATWVDDTLSCTIQGDISRKEIETIINSIYTKD